MSDVTSDAIVRELAERGPFWSGEHELSCVFCDYSNSVYINGVRFVEAHEPGCLWRRAKALWPADGPTTRRH